MSDTRPLFPLAARHLDAGGRLGEILFGLIMTLTFTLGAGIVIDEEGRAGARELLIATIGCNLAWGLNHCLRPWPAKPSTARCTRRSSGGCVQRR